MYLFDRFDTCRNTAVASDSPDFHSVIQLNTGLHGGCGKRPWDCTYTFKWVEGSLGMNHCRNECQRTRRVIETLRCYVSPDAERIDDRLRQSRAPEHRTERSHKERDFDPRAGPERISRHRMEVRRADEAARALEPSLTKLDIRSAAGPDSRIAGGRIKIGE
jgi:hypothetical protein